MVCGSIATEKETERLFFSHRIINQHIKVRKTIFNGTATLHSLLPPPRFSDIKVSEDLMLQIRGASNSPHRFTQVASDMA